MIAIEIKPLRTPSLIFFTNNRIPVDYKGILKFETLLQPIAK